MFLLSAIFFGTLMGYYLGFIEGKQTKAWNTCKKHNIFLYKDVYGDYCITCRKEEHEAKLEFLSQRNNLARGQEAESINSPSEGSFKDYINKTFQNVFSGISTNIEEV